MVPRWTNQGSTKEFWENGFTGQRSVPTISVGMRGLCGEVLRVMGFRGDRYNPFFWVGNKNFLN